jgi:hypothetical protein
MIQITIHGATPKSGPSLCKTCKHAKSVKGQNCQEIVLCHMFSPYGGLGRVPFRVAECVTYHPSNVPWLREMEEMAWKIEARKRGPVGFEPDKCDMEIVITKPKSSGPPED